MLRFGKRGKREEFEAETKPHLDTLYRAALRMTGSAEAAEDLVQETCLKAFKGFDQYQSGTNYRAWLFKIMANSFIDQHRRQPKATIVALDPYLLGDETPADWPMATAADDPEEQLRGKSFRDAALRAMERLSPEVRLVVALAVFEEASYAEIAEILGCPIGTVRSRLSRGRQQLQVELRAYARDQDTKPVVEPGITAVRKANGT